MSDNDLDGILNREAVRSSDRVLFSYEPVNREEYSRIVDDFRRGISIYNQSGLADIQMYIGAQNALNRIRERDDDLGLFLQHLDTKVNILLQKVRAEKSPFDAMQLMEVNLSAKGVAFHVPESLNKGELLSFHISLLPDYIYLYCFGRVVDCIKDPEADPDKAYRIAAEFTLITEDDKERLIQHNFKQQSLALRNRRLNP
ncbi:MAG: PilZ domain-containing protein [Proteobacteria bacterium]|nr:PilZ domain-containing protein [Pseudomonadota bacterium]MBU1714615.1 PilZ domain-containing protein [Pseudomonadota bacterium]